jgi:hypothetical protein
VVVAFLTVGFAAAAGVSLGVVALAAVVLAGVALFADEEVLAAVVAGCDGFAEPVGLDALLVAGGFAAVWGRDSAGRPSTTAAVAHTIAPTNLRDGRPTKKQPLVRQRFLKWLSAF